jgi:hypothetical protein
VAISPVSSRIASRVATHASYQKRRTICRTGFVLAIWSRKSALSARSSNQLIIVCHVWWSEDDREDGNT